MKKEWTWEFQHLTEMKRYFRAPSCCQNTVKWMLVYVSFNKVMFHEEVFFILNTRPWTTRGEAPTLSLWRCKTQTWTRGSSDEVRLKTGQWCASRFWTQTSRRSSPARGTGWMCRKTALRHVWWEEWPLWTRIQASVTTSSKHFFHFLPCLLSMTCLYLVIHTCMGESHKNTLVTPKSMQKYFVLVL